MAARPQHSVAYKKLCRRIRALRIAAGLTQRQLAEKLGMHNSMIHRTEIGDRRMDPIEFAGWCRACGADAGREIQKLL